MKEYWGKSGEGFGFTSWSNIFKLKKKIHELSVCGEGEPRTGN